MTTFGMIICIGVGIVIGLYVASQIGEHIDSRKRHEKFLKDMEAWDKRPTDEIPCSKEMDWEWYNEGESYEVR
tara:strand:+ start:178 stop:396 length:219 start_codon:yes stop_codon:yes gene_type:complete